MLFLGLAIIVDAKYYRSRRAMMKDIEGTLIHIDDVVTLTDHARPRRFIGKQAKVIAYGDINLKVEMLDFNPFTKSYEIKRFPPSMVKVGLHHYQMPFKYNAVFIETLKPFVRAYFEDTMDYMIREKVISAEEHDRIIAAYKTYESNER